jgi:rare lipoprotein A
MGVLRVQVGAFADLQNARALLERIRHDYPGGRIAQITASEGRRYRVQIGQFLTESEAQAAAIRLDRSYDVQSFVVRDDTPAAGLKALSTGSQSR